VLYGMGNGTSLGRYRNPAILEDFFGMLCFTHEFRVPTPFELKEKQNEPSLHLKILSFFL
jgi:hypothetical protein